jgi:hypothetical protein
VPAGRRARATFVWGAALVALATAARLGWVLAVPTVPVSDFAMYRESANYLSEFGSLDSGFIYMPGFVALLAWVKDCGGDLLAQKLLGVFFGGLGAAGLFVVAWKLVDGDADGREDASRRDPADDDPDGWRRICPCPYAVVATLIYALWPAGIAMASVVGTDVPAAALLVAALALLVSLGPQRPWLAALAFGVAMGLAAWVRAVALPLSTLALGYWLARRQRWSRAVGATAVGLAATLVVLLPWGVRHVRQSGALYFTDDHGGITALIGANPNSEGTYTRALNRTFKDLTGRGVLDEPHHQTDQAAYALAREWTGYEPRYALGLAVFKAERLFDPEERLLYWPIFRPGVLVGPSAAWFAARHTTLARFADLFGLTVVALSWVGLAVAVARRRWSLLALVPFQLALIATYTAFFAEPRYRLPIEILAFPFVALALGELGGAVRALARWRRPEARPRARALAPAGAMVVVWLLGWPALLGFGQALRARHRWAATEVRIEGPTREGPTREGPTREGPTREGRTRLLLWKPAPPLAARSPIEGAPNGLHLRTGDDGVARARVRLGEGTLAAGNYRVTLRAAWEAGMPVRACLGTAGADGAVDVAAGAPVTLEKEIAHAGGPLAFDATLWGAPRSSIWIDEARIDLAGDRGARAP